MRDKYYDRAVVLFNQIDGFGPMHITVEDGNIDDHHLDFCRKECFAEGIDSGPEHELLNILYGFPEPMREAAWLDAQGR